MASQIEICNRALSKLGADRITSIDDDIKSARAMKAAWNVVRDAELRAHNWNFSVKRTSLPALATAPVWGYPYQYALPADYIKLLEIRDLYPAADLSDYRTVPQPLWQVEGNTIRTDIQAPLYIRYVSRVSDPTKYDSSFVEALACRLAAETAIEIADSRSLKMDMWDEYKQAIMAALRADAIEQPNEHLLDDTWVMCRL